MGRLRDVPLDPANMTTAEIAAATRTVVVREGVDKQQLEAQQMRALETLYDSIRHWSIFLRS